MKLLPKFSLIQLWLLWAFIVLVYIAWLGPLLVSAEFTPIVLLGFTIPAILIFAFIKLFITTITNFSTPKETK